MNKINNGTEMNGEHKGEIRDEITDESQKAPKAMPFILCDVFIERFCSAGVSGKHCESVKSEKDN